MFVYRRNREAKIFCFYPRHSPLPPGCREPRGEHPHHGEQVWTEVSMSSTWSGQVFHLFFWFSCNISYQGNWYIQGFLVYSCLGPLTMATRPLFNSMTGGPLKKLWFYYVVDHVSNLKSIKNCWGNGVSSKSIVAPCS